MQIYDAILLAGDRRGAKNVFGKNKSLLEVKGIPSFIRVLSALQKVESIGEIRIVGPEEEIKSLLEKHSGFWQGEKTVIVVPQKESIVDNVWTTFLEMLPNYKKGEEPPPDLKEKALLVAAGDCPLIIPDEINEFIANSDLSRFDYYVGVVSDKTLSHYMPRGRKSEIRMALLPMKELSSRVNNLHLLKPFKIENMYRLQEMYELRYQRKIGNIGKLFLKIFRLKGFKRGAFFYLLIQSALFFRSIGLVSLYKFVSSYLTLKRYESIIGSVLSTKISIAETTYGGAAMDIDNENDYRVINKKFDEWMSYQESLGK